MIRGYPAGAVREAERPLLEAGQPLMRRAAAALAEQVRRRLDATRRAGGQAPRVLVLAGAGSNGGDGLHAAAMLREAGLDARAWALAENLHEEGAAALRAAGGTITPLSALDAATTGEELARTDLVLNAILGLGGRPRVPEHLAPVLEAVRGSGLPVIAVDLPSFVDATTGQAAPAVLPAVVTVTFGAVKAGLLLGEGSHLAGDVVPVDLGLGPHLAATDRDVLRLEDADVATAWPRPGREDSKYSRGVVALLAGSAPYPGAAVLAASGAARAGAGMVRLLAPEAVRTLVLGRRPEVVGHPAPDEPAPDQGAAESVDIAGAGRSHALVIGPGLAPEDPRTAAGLAVLRGDVPAPQDLRAAVLDAGALGALAPGDRLDSGPAEVVLTPHRGEAERLAARLGLDPELPGPELARALAAALGATVLLKGAVTVIAPRDGGPLLAQDDATSYLATAGTGDVLAGILGTLLAAGLPAPEAAAAAALLHGRAGRDASHGGRVPLVALEVAEHLPGVLAAILAGGPETTQGAR